MSYIVPRKKPNRCTNCLFMDRITYDCKLMYGDDYPDFESQYEHCPLVEIPTPHGRLIDADGFEKVMNDKLLPLLIAKYGEEAMRGMHFSFRDSICNIQAQPTVIEREDTK